MTVRLREITDPDLKLRIMHALAARRGLSPASLPEWFELDDLDFVDLLNDLNPAVEPDTLGDDEP